MKKIVLINSLIFGLVGMGANPAATPVIARDIGETNQIAQSPDTQVKLLERGSQPRQVLRFTPTPDTKQRSTMTMDMDVNLAINGQSNPSIEVPKMKMDIETQVMKVDNNGDIHAEFVYTNTDVVADSNIKPDAIEAMGKQLRKIEGFKGTIVTDDRGNIKDINYNYPETLPQTDRRFLEQILNSFAEVSAPLPLESVGIGAQWQVINNLTVNGIDITQTTTYELIDRQNNTITLAANIQQNSDTKKIDLQQMPPGAEVEVLSYNGKGKGKMQIELNKIMPVEYTGEASSNNKIKVTNTNTSQEVVVETESNVTVNLESN